MKPEHRVLDSPPEASATKASASDENSVTRRKLWLRWLFRLLLGAAIFAFLAVRHDASSLWWSLRGVSPFVLLVSVVFYWLGQWLSAWKWRILLRAQGAEVGNKTAFRLYLVGMFWNLWMPTNIGGDVVRALRVAPFCGGKSVATASVLVERLTGVVALFFVAACGLSWQLLRNSTDQAAFAVVRPLVFVAGVLLFLLFVFGVARCSVARNATSKWHRKWRAFSDALALYGAPSSRRALWFSLLISVVFQSSQILLNVFLARAVGLDISIATFWWLVPSLAIASLVPLGIGGLGVREAAALQLLAGSGAPAATIIAWSLLWQTTVWLSSLPGVFWATARE